MIFKKIKFKKNDSKRGENLMNKVFKKEFD